MVVGWRSFFFFTKSFYLLIIKDIFQVLISLLLIFINKLNLDIIFKVTWIRFMRLKKLIYMAVKKSDTSFKNLYLIRSDNTFFEQNQYAMLRLKHSKIDINYIGVFILLTVNKNSICPITALSFLFTHNP